MSADFSDSSSSLMGLFGSRIVALLDRGDVWSVQKLFENLREDKNFQGFDDRVLIIGIQQVLRSLVESGSVDFMKTSEKIECLDQEQLAEVVYEQMNQIIGYRWMFRNIYEAVSEVLKEHGKEMSRPQLLEALNTLQHNGKVSQLGIYYWVSTMK